MSSDSKLSFIYGAIAGAGAVLALMSYGFLQFIEGLENIQGVSTTEVRIAIVLGALDSAVAIGYEYYNKQKPNNEQTEEAEKKKIGEKNSAESSNQSSNE